MGKKSKAIAVLETYKEERFYPEGLNKKNQKLYDKLYDALEKDPYFYERAKYGETLTAQQKQFAQYFALTGKVLYSAKKAGLNVKTMTQKQKKSLLEHFLQRPDVRLYIDELKSRMQKRKEIGKDYIMMKLKDLVEDKKTKPSEKINALTTMAKLLGLLKEAQSNDQKVVVFQSVGLEDDDKPLDITPK